MMNAVFLLLSGPDRDTVLLVASIVGATALMPAALWLRDQMQPHLDRMERRLRAMSPARRAALGAAIGAIWCAPLFFILFIVPIRFALALICAYAAAFELLRVYFRSRRRR
jgi:hypothetical protein